MIQYGCIMEQLLEWLWYSLPIIGKFYVSFSGCSLFHYFTIRLKKQKNTIPNPPPLLSKLFHAGDYYTILHDAHGMAEQFHRVHKYVPPFHRHIWTVEAPAL
jgi:hypothetical protein